MLLATIAAGAPTTARAACTFTPTAGDDRFICDSGTSGAGLTDLAGNNTLSLPAGGTGVVNGNVTFGGGADSITVNSGTIDGAVDEGGGADSFIITGGQVTGNVQQGAGTDDFRMTGGQIGSLNQGDNIDTFRMTGGRIVDAFDDGDIAHMSGGRIGRVNMKLDNNLFDMSGGTIDRNLVTGFGNDTIILSDGVIGGNVSVSGGTDSVTVTGGTIGGEVRMSFGSDTFTWGDGGIIYGLVDLGEDNDTATLGNLTNANLGALPQLTGGGGTDDLTFSNVTTGGISRFQGFESIAATNDTELLFDGTLTLGDNGTQTGALSVDSRSTLFGGGENGGVASFSAAALATVTNSGRIDLTNGGDSTSDTFTIRGNYVGNDGLVFLDTVLGDDTSASDKLVVSGGRASGATSLGIVQAGGEGDLTQDNGILVVQAVDGATTDSGAFALDGRVAAGAYEYFLFKGGISAGTTQNWYLRSALVSDAPTTAAPVPEPGASEPDPEAPEAEPPGPPALEEPPAPLPTDGTATTDPVDPTPPLTEGDPAAEAAPTPPEAAASDPPPPPPVAGTGIAGIPGPGGTGTPPNAGATPVEGAIVPLYRVEGPTYSAVMPAARALGLASLGTFHERRGDQSLLGGIGVLSTGWGRAFGADLDMAWEGTVSPAIDGNLYGLQAGQDIFGWESGNGHVDRVGAFFAYGRIDGDLKGQALGWNGLDVGHLKIDGTSVGGYWTHVGPGGWYADGVVMGTWIDGDAHSNEGLGVDVDGSAVTASLEGGYPIALSGRWTLEPQAQLVWQKLSIDDQADRFSSVSFDSDSTFDGRLGARLEGNFEASGTTFQPYLKADLWHAFDADETVRFGADPIVTEIGGTSLEFGGGVVARLPNGLGLYANADYTHDVDGPRTRVFEGDVGLKMTW